MVDIEHDQCLRTRLHHSCKGAVQRASIAHVEELCLHPQPLGGLLRFAQHEGMGRVGGRPQERHPGEAGEVGGLNFLTGQAFLTGLAHLYNLIPYQRRALNAGKCGVEVEGGVLPTPDWMTNLQILTSGGYRCALEPPNH